MKTVMVTCVTAATVFYWATISAATLIEERDSETSTITYIEGGKMRAVSPGEEGYVLVDLLGRTMFTVSPAEKQAIDMSTLVYGQTGGEEPVNKRSVKSGLEKVGSGPEIAGYPTAHYVLTANGRKCGEYFTSIKAFEDSGWAELWTDVSQSMKDMDVSDQDADDCDIAEAEAVDPGEIGWPLRTLGADGLISEVVRIERNATVPPGGFDIPPGYSVISMEEMMSRGMMGGAYGSDAESLYEEGDEEMLEGLDMEEEDYVTEEEQQEEADVTETMKGLFNEFKKGFGD
jgi:hypothetical protein